jgi:uncharacterized membrane protein HdeD (DUF308 family)
MSQTAASPMTAFEDDILGQRLRSSSGWMLWLGLAMVGLGIAAILFPNVSTMATEMFVGWMMLLSGVLLFIGSFSITRTGPFFGALLLSLLSVPAGLFLLANPAVGAIRAGARHTPCCACLRPIGTHRLQPRSGFVLPQP